MNGDAKPKPARMLLPIADKFGISWQPMKKLILVTWLIAFALGSRAALPQPDLVAQIHFAGGTSIASAQNYSAFATEFSSNEARALRAQTADKLARFFASWFAQNSGATVNAGAARLRPLLNDLQNNEWYLEARNVGGKVETTIAVKTDDASAQAWSAGLKPFFPTGVFQRGGGWLSFSTSARAPNISGKISSLNGAWLSLDVNWPALGNFYPSVRELELPETKFIVTATATDVKIDGTFYFPQTINAPMDAWQVPTNTIHQPFISFTAVRGIASWLATQLWAAPYMLNPVPNQIYFWALLKQPFQSFAAVPCRDSWNALQQMKGRLESLNAEAIARNDMQFSLMLKQTDRMLVVLGLPFIVPYFEAVSSLAGQFLLAAGFPNTPKSLQPLPPELFTRLAQKNILFYHWEITAERMSPLLQVTQFALMATWHKQLDGHSNAFKWIQLTGPKLGNTVTEVFQTAPDQMTFTRKAPGAFTAMEFFALANWLEADDFPGCNLKMPPRNPKFKRHQVPAPAAGK